jgi:hypothetical protein
MKLFSKENGIVFVNTLTAVMVGLAIHQVYVVLILVKKYQQFHHENSQGNYVSPPIDENAHTYIVL